MNECVNKDFFLVSNLAVVSIKIERGLGFICLTYYQLLSRDRLVVVGELALPFSVDDKENDGDDGDEGDDRRHEVDDGLRCVREETDRAGHPPRAHLEGDGDDGRRDGQPRELLEHGHAVSLGPTSDIRPSPLG